MSGEVVLGYFEDLQQVADGAAALVVSLPQGADASASQKEWTLAVNTSDKAQVEALAQTVAAQIAEEVAFEASSSIGSSVAGYARVQGMLAIFGSLLCVVAYLWLRFKRAIFGISAVVGLVHDVLFTLGLLGLSYWLAPFLGFLGIAQFKIGLATVAAFLTLIGYSLNDTIILFDRIREVRGKSEALTKEIINRATNECLSRTLLTSLTTLFTALVLYAFGGAGIHTFAFAMSVGVIVGTFSSIFICAPFLLWLLSRQASKTPSNRVK
jgi:SecD/SecF fusion protein